MNKTINRLLHIKDTYFFLAILFILTCLTFFVYYKNYTYPPIKSDGKGYYLYLPSVFIYQDLTKNWTMAERIEENRDTNLSVEWYGTSEYENSGKLLNKYAIGLSIIWLPFFLIADFLTFIFGQDRTGFTIFYHASIGFAGVLVSAFGIVFLRKLLKNYFTQSISTITSLIVLFGTNLLHYATYDSTFTHAFSFTILVLILLNTIEWNKKMTYLNTLSLAFLLGLAVVVRPTNALFIVPVLMYGINSFTDIKIKLAYWKTNWKKVLFAISVGATSLLPQLAYWKYITGNWIVFSYTNESFDFSNPKILESLFSVQKGLFFWTPILVLSILGFLVLRKYAKNWMLGFTIYLPLTTYIISSWWAWQYGSSYGHRIFVDSYAIFAILMASFMSYIFYQRRLVYKVLLCIVISVCTFASLFMMLQYWQGDIPQENTSWSQYSESWLHQFGLVESLTVEPYSAP